jgi:hypothetical protein
LKHECRGAQRGKLQNKAYRRSFGLHLRTGFTRMHGDCDIGSSESWFLFDELTRYAVVVPTLLPARDQELIQITDAALVDATRRAGAWLVCRPGCTQCCIGPFPISQLDVARLRNGLAMLEKSDPQRANRVRERTRQAIEKLSESFSW